MELTNKQKYEMVVLTDKAMPTIYATLSRIFKKADAVLFYKETLGRRKLHYIIEKNGVTHSEAYYYFASFYSAENLLEFESLLSSKDYILKSIIIRADR